MTELKLSLDCWLAFVVYRLEAAAVSRKKSGAREKLQPGAVLRCGAESKELLSTQYHTLMIHHDPFRARQRPRSRSIDLLHRSRFDWTRTSSRPGTKLHRVQTCSKQEAMDKIPNLADVIAGALQATTEKNLIRAVYLPVLGQAEFPSRPLQDRERAWIVFCSFRLEPNPTQNIACIGRRIEVIFLLQPQVESVKCCGNWNARTPPRWRIGPPQGWN